MHDYFDKNILSKYQYGLREGFNTQHALPVTIEKMKISRDNQGILRGYSSRVIESF